MIRDYRQELEKNSIMLTNRIKYDTLLVSRIHY